MKNIIRLIVFAVFMVTACTAEMTPVEMDKPQEGQTIADVETLAIGAPLYTSKEGYPSKEEYVGILNDMGAKVLKERIVTYNTVAQGIRQKTGKDVYTLDRIPAAKIFKDNVMDFADAYLVSTVTMSRRTVMFFDVYRAGTNELLYGYELILDNEDKDDVKTYSELVEKFYKHFISVQESQKKEKEKADRKAQKEREKAERKAQKEREGK